MRIAMNTKSLIPWALSVALALVAHPGQGLANSKCVEGIWPSAKSAGVTRATFDRAFQGFTPDPEVIEQANYQPEYVKPVGEYIDRAVSDKRVATGKEKLAEYQDLVAGLEKRYGVDRHIIVAIWGVEFELRRAARRQERHPVARHAHLFRHQGKVRQAPTRLGAEDSATRRREP